MTQITPNGARTTDTAEIGAQPVALAAGAFLAVVFGVALIGGWRAYSGNSPEQDHPVAARPLQHRTTQVSERAESARALQATQQDTVDELQMVQDQLRTVRHLLADQQAETTRLTEQVSRLRETIDGLRQSFTNAQGSDPSIAAGPHARSIGARLQSK